MCFRGDCADSLACHWGRWGVCMETNTFHVYQPLKVVWLRVGASCPTSTLVSVKWPRFLKVRWWPGTDNPPLFCPHSPLLLHILVSRSFIRKSICVTCPHRYFEKISPPLDPHPFPSPPPSKKHIEVYFWYVICNYIFSERWLVLKGAANLHQCMFFCCCFFQGHNGVKQVLLWNLYILILIHLIQFINFGWFPSLHTRTESLTNEYLSLWWVSYSLTDAFPG